MVGLRDRLFADVKVDKEEALRVDILDEIVPPPLFKVRLPVPPDDKVPVPANPMEVGEIEIVSMLDTPVS